MEFRVICKRGLELQEEDGVPTIPMATLAELDALLDHYQPLQELTGSDIALPSTDSQCSIVNVPVLQILDEDTIALPDKLVSSGRCRQSAMGQQQSRTQRRGHRRRSG